MLIRDVTPDDLERLAEEAGRAWNLPLDACREYLAKECWYEPGEQLGPALRAFGEAASKIGLTDPRALPSPLPLPGGALR